MKQGSPAMDAALLLLALFLACVSAFQGAPPAARRVNVHPEYSPDGNWQDDGDRPGSIVEACFDAVNRRDLEAVLACFAEDCSYEDTMFESPFVGRDGLRDRFGAGIGLLPAGCVVVLDDLAAGRSNSNIGARWHLEVGGRSVPFSRGCSFYTTDPSSGLIETGFRVTETPVKPDDLALSLLNLPLRIISSTSPSPSKESPPPLDDSVSIVHKYFDGWNRRDMDAAVSCFADEVVYEDTLYIRPFSGKEALREHLVRATRALPPTCRINVDSLAIGEGNIGATWSLVDDGDGGRIKFPRVRGCSMYAVDEETGLLTSGFDVTEPPIKASNAQLGLVSWPLRALRGF